MNKAGRHPAFGNKMHALRAALFLAAGFCASAASDAFAAPAANSPAALQLTPQVSKLLDDADKAMAAGNLNLALIQLKNAVRLAPSNGEVHARLGVAFLQNGEAIPAERELRQARDDDGPAETIVPALLRAMLQRNEFKELLAEFKDPAPGTQDPVAADVLRARALAFQAAGQPKESRAAMDRSLFLRRDIGGLVSSAALASDQKDFKLAQSLVDEAAKLEPNNEQAFVISVMLARQSGDSQKALALTDDFEKRVPNSVIARVFRIDQMLALKEDVKAKQEIDALIKQAPRSLYGPYYRGVMMARAKDFKGAWQIMQSLQPEFVQSQPTVAMMVASVAAASGNLESAGAILTTLVARKPNVPQARFQLAAIRISQGSARAAVDVLNSYKDGKDPTVHALLAQAYLMLKQYDEAIASLEIASSAPGANNLLKEQLALSQLQTGDVDEALQGLRDLHRRNLSNTNIAAVLTATLTRARKWDEALSVVDDIAKNSPKGSIPSFYRAQVLIARGDLSQAQSELDKAIMADATFMPAVYYRANVLAARGDIDAARKDLEQYIAKNPTNVQAYLKLADIALNNGREQDVPVLYARAMKAAPKDATPRLALANYLLSRGKNQEAQAAVTEALQLSRNNPLAIALQGQIQIQTGKADESIKTYRNLVAASPSPGSYAFLARALYTSKDQVGAEDAAKRAIALAPDSAQTRQLLVDIQLGGSKGDDALRTARAFANEKPGPEADLLVGTTLLRLNRTKEAEALLDKSLGAKPDARMAVAVAQLASRSGNTKKALGVLANWTNKNPDDFSTRREYAALMMQSGDLNGARKEYEALLKQSPEDPVLLNNLGWLVQKDNPARALSLVALAAKIAPRSAEIVDTLGWLKYQQKDHEGALPVLQRAHDIDANNAPISYHLALALDANGKRTEAKSLLQAALAKDAKFDGAEDARRVLARW
jgi:putative PEP-CTERM system TPR-repeat lipoprotein